MTLKRPSVSVRWECPPPRSRIIGASASRITMRSEATRESVRFRRPSARDRVERTHALERERREP